MDETHPKIEGAPGLTWRLRNGRWEARWRCRTDLGAKGYRPKVVRLWAGTGQPNEMETAFIRDRCREQQDEMLTWASGGKAPVAPFDGTLGSLIGLYMSDEDSTFQKFRYHSRRNHEMLLARIRKRHGHAVLAELTGRTFIGWHKEWLGPNNTISMAHWLISELRTLFSYGFTLLQNDQCQKLGDVLAKMRFPNSKPRTERMTAAQAVAIRAEAHKLGMHSLALCQAFQYDLMLRQKDMIGEWIPNNEPGMSDVTYASEKWMMGARWSEIDGNLIFRHVTSKRTKEIEIDLKLAPMVMEEFERIAPGLLAVNEVTKAVTVNRGLLPAAGPIIVNEKSGRPYGPTAFRQWFRTCREKAGVPKAVKNMDSRAGGITEASEAGADLEHIKHAATHSDIAMTQKYSRGATDKIDNVMRLRRAHRNKTRTDGGANEG